MYDFSLHPFTIKNDCKSFACQPCQGLWQEDFLFIVLAMFLQFVVFYDFPTKCLAGLSILLMILVNVETHCSAGRRNMQKAKDRKSSSAVPAGLSYVRSSTNSGDKTCSRHPSPTVIVPGHHEVYLWASLLCEVSKDFAMNSNALSNVQDNV